MIHRPVLALAASAVLLLAACSSGGAAPSTGGAPSTGVAPSAGGAASAAASACKESTDPGAVTVTVVDFAFQPANVTAKTGQVIAFSNTGSASHTATLDNGGCATGTINAGKSDGLVFTTAGTYTFHCSIHPTRMKGTIVVS